MVQSQRALTQRYFCAQTWLRERRQVQAFATKVATLLVLIALSLLLSSITELPRALTCVGCLEVVTKFNAIAPATLQSRTARPLRRTLRIGRGAVGGDSDIGASGAAENEEQGSGGVEDESDDTNVELFRQSLIQGWARGGGLGSASADETDWAEIIREDDTLVAGDILLGSPMGFIGEGGSEAGPERVGLTSRISEDWPSREQLRLIPVVLVTRIRADGGAEGVCLTMRTGRLMGDYVNHFHTRPLHFGGPEKASLTMIHPYQEVPGSERLSKDGGLYLGGDFGGAQEWVEEGQGSELRFRFFVNRIRWKPGELFKEVRGSGEQVWIPVRCSADLVLAEVDSIDEKPLWVRIAELAGGEAEELGRRFGFLS